MEKRKNLRTRVKFCGLCRPEDGAAAAAAGADAVGLVFYPEAAVAVDTATATAITESLPLFVDVVALFVNPPEALVREVVAAVRPHYLQFHGDEDADFCRRFAVPYIKACRVGDESDIAAAAAAHPHCHALLLDSRVAGVAGGSGRAFDWSYIPSASALPLMVAGGLTAATVGDLIRDKRPFAVDVSSGIAEATNRRRKNWRKMREFMEKIRDADIH